MLRVWWGIPNTLKQFMLCIWRHKKPIVETYVWAYWVYSSDIRPSFLRVNKRLPNKEFVVSNAIVIFPFTNRKCSDKVSCLPKSQGKYLVGMNDTLSCPFGYFILQKIRDRKLSQWFAQTNLLLHWSTYYSVCPRYSLTGYLYAHSDTKTNPLCTSRENYEKSK